MDTAQFNWMARLETVARHECKWLVAGCPTTCVRSRLRPTPSVPNNMPVIGGGRATKIMCTCSWRHGGSVPAATNSRHTKTASVALGRA
eukprot:3935375-Rhodomonas_salina.2